MASLPVPRVEVETAETCKLRYLIISYRDRPWHDAGTYISSHSIISTSCRCASGALEGPLAEAADPFERSAARMTRPGRTIYGTKSIVVESQVPFRLFWLHTSNTILAALPAVSASLFTNALIQPLAPGASDEPDRLGSPQPAAD